MTRTCVSCGGTDPDPVCQWCGHIRAHGLGRGASHIARDTFWTICGLMIDEEGHAAAQPGTVVQRPGVPRPLPRCRKCRGAGPAPPKQEQLRVEG